MAQHAPFPKTNKVLLALIIPAMMAYSTQSTAQDTNEPEVTVDALKVTVNTKPREKVGEKIVTRRELDEQMVQDNRDLVRYNPEVTVAETGRFGSKGFAIRGVDENRVSMSVDGIALPELEVNQIYMPYGYMYSGRLAIDPEIMRNISIQTGADSLTSGNGSLGGAVNYTSKEPSDLIRNGNNFGGYAKIGYASKNEENMAAVGLATSTKHLEGLVNYVRREGHELKNHRMEEHNSDKLAIDYNFPSNEVGTSGILPDPSDYKSDNLLAKIYYHVNDEHRFGIFGNYLSRKDHSYAITKGTLKSQRRMAHDKANMESYGINYRYLPKYSQLIDETNIEFAHQKVKGVAHTDMRFTSWRTGLVDSNDAYTSEHRPTSDTTKQFRLSTDFPPIDFDKFGSHKFSTVFQYTNKDHSATPQNKNACPGSSKWMCNGSDSLANDTFVYTPNIERSIFSFVVSDDVRLNDKLDAQLGVRYDNYKYKPEFTDYQKSLFSRFPDAGYGLLQNNTGRNNDTCNQSYGFSSWFYDPAKLAACYAQVADFQSYREKFQQAFTNNHPYKEDAVTYKIGLGYQLNDNWKASYKYSTGFLMPTVTQLYSAFSGMGVREETGFIHGLKPETSKNHELEFKGEFDTFAVKLGGYYVNYNDFINIKIENRDFGGVGYDTINYYNVDSAKTYGGRIGGTWDISEISKLNGTLQLMGEYAISKDSTSRGTNLIANMPANGIIGFDYHAADDGYDIHGRLRYVGSKKANDAKIDGPNNTITVSDYLPYSKSYTLFDLYGTKRFNNGFSVSAGAYNIFNEKYHSWETLRTFMGARNINAMVSGDGMQRYTSPGRNYALSLTYEF